MSHEDRIARQLELEEESVFLGYTRYEERAKTQAKQRTEDQTPPAQQLMQRMVGTVADAIELDRNASRRGKRRTALAFIEDVESEALAWHTMRVVLSSISTLNNYAHTCVRVGTSVKDELNFRRFQKCDKKGYTITQSHLATAGTGGQKHGIMSRMFKLSEIEPVKWSLNDTTHVGAYLLDITLAVTGWATGTVIRQSRNRSVRIVEPSADLLNWLGSAHQQLAVLSPVRLPMIIPPTPWTSPAGGGYLTDHGGPLSLVKTRNTEYLEALHQIEMPEVYDAINAIQETPWRINTGVLDVAQELWAEGVMVGQEGSESLPPRMPRETPLPPAEWEGRFAQWKKEDFSGYKLWASRAAATHGENRRMLSKRVSAKCKLELAERFRSDPELYFPHQLDFRGRVYPVAAHVSPQGDDLAKGLLQFAKGKALGDAGVYWLKVHIANCFGIDKVSFDERAAWTDSHADVLSDSGMEPLAGERFWMGADDPFLALAACFEWVGMQLLGPEYVSHLPISVDGSCNGLQNFSALLRDEIGGRATNLVPSGRPADVYQEVADLAATLVRQDAESGNPSAAMFDGFISRKLVKQPVMTFPYGATRNGMRSQIEDAVRKMGNPMAIATKDMWTACGYIADVTRNAIAQVVVAAAEAMTWLQESARVAANDDYPIRWTTPVGLPVLQEYMVSDAEMLRIHVDGQKVKLHIRKTGVKLDRKRQTTGISPNLIHSFDAAHLMKTVLLSCANGITDFTMVHDSFGCHGCDIGTLHASIRSAFIEMYSANLLHEFRDEVQSQMPPDAVLPPLPPVGTLELAVIEDSKYFFA